MKSNRFCSTTAVSAGAILALIVVLTFTVSAQNQLVNGGFESGALAPWTYFSNGVGSYDVETPGFSGAFCTKFAIVDGKTNTQLYQDGVRLEANTWYVLDFYAYSNNIAATELPVMVSIHKHKAPFYTYGVQSQVFPVYCPMNYPSIGGTQYRYYKIEFKTTGFTGVVRIGYLLLAGSVFQSLDVQRKNKQEAWWKAIREVWFSPDHLWYFVEHASSICTGSM